MTRVFRSARRWKVTTPAFFAPDVLFHATRSSGRCSVISEDVVAIENAPGAVPSDLHGHSLGHPAIDRV
jgi:hypothetical protein